MDRRRPAQRRRVSFPTSTVRTSTPARTAHASRWVIDFNDRRRSCGSARYELPFQQRLHDRVKPERATNQRRLAREWWQFAGMRPAMRRAIAALDEVLVIASRQQDRHARAGPDRPGIQPSSGCLRDGLLRRSGRAVLVSLHQMWAIKYGSTLRPDSTLHAVRRLRDLPPADADRSARANRQEPSIPSAARSCCAATSGSRSSTTSSTTPTSPTRPTRTWRGCGRSTSSSTSVMAAYGWGDVPLDHGFHTYRQMTRWTVSPAARVEILDRLLEENHRRAALQGERRRRPRPTMTRRTTSDRSIATRPGHQDGAAGVLAHVRARRPLVDRPREPRRHPRARAARPANGPDEILEAPPDMAYLVGRIAPVRLTAGRDDARGAPTTTTADRRR